MNSERFEDPPFSKLKFPTKSSKTEYEVRKTVLVGIDIQVSDAGLITSIKSSLSPAVICEPSFEEVVGCLIQPLITLSLQEQVENIAFLVWDRLELDLIASLLPEALYPKLINGKRIEYKGHTIKYTPSYLVIDKCTLYPLGLWSLKATLSENVALLGLPPLPVCDALVAVGRGLVKFIESVENGWVPFNAIASPAKALRRFLRRGYSTVDRIEIPAEVQEMAYKGTRAPWIELFVQGSSKRVWDYDLISAYGTVGSQLISPSKSCGKWLRSKEYQPEAEYGVVDAIVEVYKSTKPTPFQIRINSEVQRPWGVWGDIWFKEELEFLLKYNLGRIISINKGWWFIPKVRHYLFRYSLSRLLNLRQNYKGTDAFGYQKLKAMTTKIAGNFFSKRAEDVLDRESKYIVGEFFNPILYNSIVVRTTLQVAEFILNSEAEVACVTVDGVTFLDEPRNVPPTFKVEFFKKPGLFPWPLLFWIDGRMKTVDVQRLLSEAPDLEEYEVGKERKVSLLYKVKYSNPERVGASLGKRALSVGWNLDRIWNDEPVTGKDLLENLYRSEAWNVRDLA